jgi:general secretion pathway protein L
VDIVLRVSSALLLQRDCALPLAAEADLERVLGYEMDRITPFAATDLFWTWRVLRRDRAHQRLHLRLSLMQRAVLAPVLEQLRAARLSPSILAAEAAGGERLMIPLRHRASHSQRRGTIRIAAAICTALALAVIATPFVQNLSAIAAAEGRIDALRPAIARVEVLRRRLTADAGAADVFAAEAARVGDPLQMLAALTDILPDDAWLAYLTWRQRVLTFSGQSKRAARLIATLSADPAFHDPTFVTPVTRAEASGAELFTIRTRTSL